MQLRWFRLGFHLSAAPEPGVDRHAVKDMIRALLRHRWQLKPADEVFVREIACPHKDCGGFETVALVWREGRQIATLTVEKPLGQVGFADVDHALLMHGATGVPFTEQQ